MLIDLFTGSGAASIAAHHCGIPTLVMVEKDAKARALLAKNFPNIPLHEDITQYHPAQEANIIIGGDPCQPHSLLGDRAGANDPRYLWPHMLRVANEASASWIINENVPGSISNGILDTKITDLENAGYTCWPPLIIPAATAGAIHLRRRVLLVAYSNVQRWRPLQTSFGAKKTMGEDKRPTSYPDTFSSIEPTPGHICKRTLLRVADGTSERISPTARNVAMRIAGNGIYWPILVPIFQEILRIENEHI